jgi:hypothetical protein
MGGIVRDAGLTTDEFRKLLYQSGALPPNPRMQPTGRPGAELRSDDALRWRR